MGFQIMDPSPKLIWAHVDDNNGSFETLYNGQLVYTVISATTTEVLNLGTASGAEDTTGKKCILGVVVGNNLKTKVYDSTYKTESITSAAVHASTTEFYGVEGPLGAKGDRAYMVQVALIDPSSRIKGPIFNGTFGTAITVGTVTTASTDGTGFTCSAGLLDWTPTTMAGAHTVYCRSGGNMGLYRIADSVSATVITVNTDFPYDIALGDTFVGAPLRPFGFCYMQTDAEAMFINAAGGSATNYWGVFVEKLDLSTAGSEYAIFRFGSAHFNVTRA